MGTSITGNISFSKDLKPDPIRSGDNMKWKNRDLKPSDLVLVDMSNFQDCSLQCRTRRREKRKPNLEFKSVPANSYSNKGMFKKPHLGAPREASELKAKIREYIPEKMNVSMPMKKELVTNCPSFIRNSIIRRVMAGERWEASQIKYAKDCGSIQKAAKRFGHLPIFR